MTLTKEDLEAFVKAEAEIRDLPTFGTPPVENAILAAMAPRLTESEEFRAAEEAAKAPVVRPDCTTPKVIFKTCQGEERRCFACSMVMTMSRVVSLGSGELCPYGCGKILHECWQLVGQAEE